MLSVSDLFSPITEDQMLETFLSTLESLGIPARSWRTGGAYRNILRTVARTFAGFTTVMSDFAQSGFLDSASAGWLTLLAHFVYGVDRTPATFATGQVLFTNVGGGVYDEPAGTVTVLWVTNNKAYVTTEDLHLHNPGDTALLNVQAVEIGAASSAGPGLIDTLQTTLLGVTVTNPLAVVGSDPQSDDDLRATCRNKIAALSLLGPRGAYQYAVSVATRSDGTPVNINRTTIVSSPTTGTVTVYVASPSGAPLSTDLDIIRASVELWARPDSVTAVVVGATPVPFSQGLTVWARATPGVAATDVQNAVDSALTAMVSVYPIGGLVKPPSIIGYLYASNIEGVAKGAHPSIFAVDGANTDLLLTAGEVATLASTVTVRIVSQ